MTAQQVPTMQLGPPIEVKMVQKRRIMGPKGKMKTVLQPYVEGPNGDLVPAMMCPNWVLPAGLPTKR